jgi:hypothetical protein
MALFGGEILEECLNFTQNGAIGRAKKVLLWFMQACMATQSRWQIL